MYLSSLHGHGTSGSSSWSGAPRECRHGMKNPGLVRWDDISPRNSASSCFRIWLPMCAMMRMLMTAYAESVTWTPILASGESVGPMQNGTMYMVRPFMDPLNFSVRMRRMFSSSCHWLVGPAWSLRFEQMNVRSSTRATSEGADLARKLFGLLSGLSWMSVPAATSCCVSRFHSASDPSHKWMSFGWQRSAILAIHELRGVCLEYCL